MNNREINFCLTPQKSIRVSKKSFLINDGNKRIERKPSMKQLKSPKHQMSSIQLDGALPEQCHPPKQQNQIHKSQQNKIDVNSLSRSICYLSPKHANMSCIFQPNVNDQKNNENYRSMDDIKFKQMLHNNRNTVSPYSNANKIKNKQTRQTRYSNNKYYDEDVDNNININNSFVNTSFNKKIENNEKEQLEAELKFINGQNKQLMVQNLRLNQRLALLKQENEYLYKQIQLLNSEIKNQNDSNLELTTKNNRLNTKIVQDQNEMEQFKKNYKIQEGIRKNYQILQRMYKKIKSQQTSLINRNQSLLSQNQKLAHQISDLSKMLDEIPIQPKRPRKKSKQKQLYFGFDKENCGSSSSFSPPSVINTKFCRFAKSSREDQSIFDLSPE